MRPLARGGLREFLLLATATMAAAAGVSTYAAHLLRSAELSSVDARFSVRGKEPPPNELVVVAIDTQTFNDLGLQWPFPRSLHGRVIDRLRAAGARAIVYDVQFTEPTTASQDNALIDAVRRAGNVALATTEVGSGGTTNVFGGGDALRYSRARVGNASFPPQPGGVLRRVYYSVNGLRSLPVVAAQIATGRRLRSGDLGGSSAWIDYRGPPGAIPAVSYSRVLRGQIPASRFRGKVVVVGPSAISLQDVHPTSTTGDALMSGAEVQANAIYTALHRAPLRSSSAFFDVLLIIVFSVAVPLASTRLSPVLLIGLAVVLGAAFAGVVQLAFDSGRVLPFVYPLLGLVVSSGGSLAVHYLTEAFERQRVRDLFGRFVSDSVVEQVLANRGLWLRGVRLESTVLFSDLRGFTSFAEQLDPEAVVDILNRYLTEMSNAILDHGGTLVAYMGDGIMAVFGAPVTQEDHGDRALAAGREMLRRLEGFNAWMRDEGLGEGFKMGIGLNTGPVMSGTVGSERRMEYTAIGDTTNTAARLEGMTKGTPHQLYLSESTREALRRPPAGLVFVDEMEVRGRHERLRVWTVRDSGPEAAEGNAETSVRDRDQSG